MLEACAMENTLLKSFAFFYLVLFLLKPVSVYGNSLDAAKRAVKKIPYSTPEILAKHQLLTHQKLELAKYAARTHGAIFSDIVSTFKLTSEKNRFLVAMIAAKNNAWRNIKFNVGNFELSDSKLRFRLARSVVTHAPWNLAYLQEWRLSRRESLQLMKDSVAIHPRAEFLKHWHSIPNLTEAETLQLLLAAAHTTDVYTLFDRRWLPTEASRIILALAIARVSPYFMEYLPFFGISSPEAYRLIVQANLRVPQTQALMFPNELKLSPADLLEAYFTVRDLLGLPQANSLGTNYVNYSEADPVLMLEQFAGFTFPKIERPGHIDQSANISTEDFVTAVESRREETLSAATKIPDLLPINWVRMAYEHFDDGVIAAELLRQCYQLSTRAKLYKPTNALTVAFESVGLKPIWKIDDYSYADRKNIIIELLSLQHKMPLPVFRSIRIDPNLYAPQNSNLFVRFLQSLRARIHHDTAMNEALEWDGWLRLRENLNLTATQIESGTVNNLINRLSERPSALKPLELPSCEGIF
jgi:hypothetical protein